MNTRIIPELGSEPAEVLEIKPFKHIEKLIDNILPYAERRIVSKGRSFIITIMTFVSVFYLSRAALLCIVAETGLF